MHSDDRPLQEALPVPLAQESLACHHTCRHRTCLPASSDEDPFEVDRKAGCTFVQAFPLDPRGVYDVWASDPFFYPDKLRRAHWLMCAEIAGRVLVVPLAPAGNGDPRRRRLIGCCEAAQTPADQYRRDR